jgi:hypothetical protein
LVAAAWQPAVDRFPGTVLGHMVPWADRSLSEDAERMWESPPLDPHASEAEALLAERFPDTGQALVLIEPDLTTEVLMQSGRINRLPIGHPRQEDLIRPEWLPEVYEAVDSLEPGTLMLTQRSVLEAPPVLGPLDAPSEAYTGAPQEYRRPVALQLLALERIRERFRLVVVERTPSGFLVMRLLPKS